jgi:DNA-binding GntR family transcriptional regulator
MIDPTFTPLRAIDGSATDRVFRALYDAVITVKLPPGSKVSEAEIAKQLDVSRQPVRDAFFRLSRLGFISIRPQRPTLITQISLRAIQDAVFTRTALEIACLHAAIATDRQALVQALSANIREQKAVLGKATVDFHACDDAFHEAICTLAGRDHVWGLIREQKAHLDRLRFLSLSEARQQFVIQEHDAILDAIKSSDDSRADALLRAHIGAINGLLPDILAHHQDYFEEPLPSAHA